MSIHADEFPKQNMSSWVAEKADTTLWAACHIIDLFRKKALEFLPQEKEGIINVLSSIINNTAKLSAFGHENIESFSSDWVKVMFDQGSERYEEFLQHVQGKEPNATPTEWPLSIQKTLNILNELDVILNLDEPDKSYTRLQVTSLAYQLIKYKSPIARTLGNKLINLIDEQAVNIQISWPEFIEKSRAILKESHESFMEQANKFAKSWI